MKKVIIPHYADGLVIDWSKTVPIDEKNVAMYLSPNFRLEFRAIFSPQLDAKFEIGEFMEKEPNILCPDFETRFENFEPYQEARIKKVFSGNKKYIFFDEEEQDILAATFLSSKYTAVIEFVLDGKAVKLTELPEDIKEDVDILLETYTAIYPMDMKEYQEYCETQKVRLVKTITPNGGKKMKKSGIKNILLGLLVEGICITGAIIGAKIIGKGTDEFTGKYKDIIMVKANERFKRDAK